MALIWNSLIYLEYDIIFIYKAGILKIYSTFFLDLNLFQLVNPLSLGKITHCNLLGHISLGYFITAFQSPVKGKHQPASSHQKRLRQQTWLLVFYANASSVTD